jgi:hypothetical protein
MTHLMSAHYFDVCRSWSRTMTGMAWTWWRLLDANSQVGIQLMQNLMGSSTGATPATGQEAGATPGADPVGPKDLEQRAAERLRKGLAPPAEVYQSPYRDRIDWLALPPWARPVDPDLFEGCGHEG